MCTEIFQTTKDMAGGLCSPQQNDKCPSAIYNFLREHTGKKSKEIEMGKEEDCGARRMAKD